MGDRRRYTGTQRLQIGWTALVSFFVVVTSTVLPVWSHNGLDLPVVLTGASICWVLGLVALGLRERRHWNAMVTASSFDHERGTSQGDLETLIDGRSIVVTTDVRSFLSQAHTEVRTSVDGVDASFTVELTHVGDGGTATGLTTGNDTLDDRFVIEGGRGNVAKILSADVQAALINVETPGICTITGEAVVYDVPFTRLSAEELETIANAVVEIATQVETVAKVE